MDVWDERMSVGEFDCDTRTSGSEYPAIMEAICLARYLGLAAPIVQVHKYRLNRFSPLQLGRLILGCTLPRIV